MRERTVKTMTIEGAISYYEGQAVYAKDHGYPLAGEWNGQIAAWLRELQVRRKVDSCDGTAQWLISSDGYYPYCSVCMAEPEDGKMTDFCPSCGAKMKGIVK